MTGSSSRLDSLRPGSYAPPSATAARGTISASLVRVTQARQQERVLGRVAAGEPGVVYTVEGGNPSTVIGSGLFDVSGEGFHEVVVTGGGETSTLVILIDSTDPTVDIYPPNTSAPLAPFSTHTVEFECFDAGSGLAAGGCTATLDGAPVEDGDPIDTTTPGTFLLEVNAVDGDGV